LWVGGLSPVARRILSKLIVCQSNIAFNMQKCMAQTVQDAQGTPVFV
jgi:hypothetical protein